MKAEANGRIWLIQKKDSDVAQFYVRRDDGFTVIYSFDELLQALDDVTPPVPFGSDVADTVASVRVLA